MKEFVRLPSSELEVMLIIWHSQEEISTSDILAQLNKQKDANLQMLQSTLNRLVGKSFVRVNKLGRLNYYSALVDAKEYRTGEASSFLERLYDSSPTKLFASLLESNTLSESDIGELKRLLWERGD